VTARPGAARLRAPGLLASALLAGGVLAALPAAAVEPVQRHLSVTPLVGYRVNGDLEADSGTGEDATTLDVGVDEGGVAGFIVNVPFEALPGGAYTEWELYASRQTVGLKAPIPAGVDPDLELEITHVLLGGTYVGPGDWIRPYIAAGLGAAHLSPDAPDTDSDTVFAFALGGGAQLFPEQRIGARLEARAIGSVIDGDTALFCGGSGGVTCAVATRSNVFWQWEVFAGLVARF
jgi:opacity protein-like surface antigen